MNCPQPHDILRYFKSCLESLAALRQITEPMIDKATIASDSQFFGMTATEFDAALKELREELEGQVVLMLVAAFEARFQTDLQERIQRRKKDEPSKVLRKWWYKKSRPKEWVAIESLLDIWKKAV